MENKVNSRLSGMLGFAMRAGKVIIGTDLVCASMAKRGKDKAKIILIAADASEGTKKKIIFKSEYYGVEAVVSNIDASELGRLLGKLYAPAAVAITDDRFAEQISLCFKSDEGQRD